MAYDCLRDARFGQRYAVTYVIARWRTVCATLLVVFLIPIVVRAAERSDSNDVSVDHWSGKIIARTLNVRKGPGEGYPIIGKLKRGDEIVAVDESGRWVRLEGFGDGSTEAWIYRAFVRLPKSFMAPALGDKENAFIDWAAARGDLAEISVDDVVRLSIVLAESAGETAAAAIAREVGCSWRERIEVEETVTVTVWPKTGPLEGWIVQATCP